MTNTKHFAVVDVETTGFHYSGNDRIIEVAIILLDSEFKVVDEYTTLINPNRDVGRTDIHGISASEVLHAPPFSEIAGDLASRLSNATLVAHNIRFDTSFLAAEFARIGVQMPPLNRLCTLEIAHDLLSEAPSRKLADCCQEFGIDVDHAHEALSDARAAGRLLAAFAERSPLPDPTHSTFTPTTIANNLKQWTDLKPSGHAVGRQDARAAHSQSLNYLSTLVAALDGDETTSAVEAEYLSVLDRALEDRVLTQNEANALISVATDWGLSRADVTQAHKKYLRALVAQAREDNVVTRLERADLDLVRQLLGLTDAELIQFLQESYESFPAPAPLAPAESLVGKLVCFTGAGVCTQNGLEISRERAIHLTQQAGLRVHPKITKKVDILIVADPSTSSSKAKKAREYGTRIMAETTFWKAIGVRVD